MSVSLDTTAHVYAAEYADRIEFGGLRAAEEDVPEMIARAIRADRQQFAPLIQKVRTAIAEQQLLPLMVAAQKLTEAMEEGVTA